MQYRRKMILTIAVVLMAVVFGPVFAGGSAEEIATPESNVIGISKIVAHPALDAVEQGIIDELTAIGFTELEYDLQNANGDISTAASIATKFENDSVRLAIGIATPTSQALVNAIDDIPVVYAAVSDPVSAGLVPSFDAGEGNVTGSSDMAPVAAQLALMTQLVDVETVGHVYASGESNAVALAAMAREAAEGAGLEFVEATVVNSSEVRSATQSIVGRVDAIYVSNDNTVVSALSALVDVAAAAGVPVISADTTSAEPGGVLAALGFDYYKFGRATGRLVADVLNGTDPESIPTLFLTDPSDLNLLVNLDVARELGITVPGSVMADASMVIENGELR
ncbi:MAG: ABC transporter substrate-binding protein [Spirochaetales bacterium]|nr:ABC transporter substrate-binding protein [Spirochaetales bacterium]